MKNRIMFMALAAAAAAVSGCTKETPPAAPANEAVVETPAAEARIADNAAVETDPALDNMSDGDDRNGNDKGAR